MFALNMRWLSCDVYGNVRKNTIQKRRPEWVDMFLIFQLIIIVSGLYLGQITSKNKWALKNGSAQIGA